MRILLPIILLLVHPQTPTKSVSEACTCVRARQDNEWCKHCDLGYVAGIKISSKLLFEEIDAHGHDIRPESIECKTCQVALKFSGFCKKCRMGFVQGQAYLSPLTYQLAKGTKKSLGEMSCTKCKKNAAAYGWCGTCNTGMVGHVAITNKTDYAKAVAAYDILKSAVRALARCEMCAISIIYDGRCDRCNLSYRNGSKVANKRLERP